MYKSLDIDVILNKLYLPMDQIFVDFSSDYDRKACHVVDDKIDTIWNNVIKKNNRIYNASKFRFHIVEVADNGNLLMKIGMTDYKETVCTHFIDNPEQILAEGENEFSNSFACFANPVGVTAAVVTLDNDVIVMRRSQWVAESKGKCDTPGGHAEPKDMLDKLSYDATQVFQASSKDVVYEIFHSIVREVRDEINIPENKLSWPILLGIMRNKRTARKPCFVFLIRCGISSKEVKELYAKGGPETDESTEIIFLKTDDLFCYSEEDFMKMKDNWSPCGLSALLFYTEHLRNLTT